MRKYFGFFLLCFFVSAASARSPYVLFAGPREYPNGYYGVISSSGVVVSTGNILQEISAYRVAHPDTYLPESPGEVGDFYIDTANNRLFLFIGIPDKHYSGILVLRLSDMGLIQYIPRVMTWGDKDIAAANVKGPKIYLTDWVEEVKGLKTFAYDGVSYDLLDKDAPPKLDLSGKYCFIPGGEKIYLHEGVRDVADQETFEYLPDSTEYTDVQCANGKVLRYKNESRKNKDYTLTVWDLQKSTTTQTIKPGITEGNARYQWVMSLGGDYAVFGEGIVSMGYRAAALLEKNFVRVFDTATGKETASVDLAKVAGVDPEAKFFFMDFSVDGKSIVFYSDLKLYVLDLKTLALQHKVPLPEAPELVVW